jgi:tripartite-type tricarboxylate transporter receptor subunit TctC
MWGVSRRGLALAALALCVPLAARAAWPDRPIRWIVPAAAGGGADSSVRVVAEALGKRLGQPVVIENRAGASGAIGLEAVAKADPDGYTIGTANLSNFVLNRHVRPQLPFDTDKDFVPVAKLTAQPNLVGINPTLPVNNMKELVAYAKAHPKALFYGSSGSGSSLHVAAEWLKQVTGIEMVHVPYKSAPAANTDLMANSIQLMIDNVSTMAPSVQAGRIRALAVTSPRRSGLLPNVPTMAEAGVPGLEMVTWGGVVAPRAVPRPIVERLGRELVAVMNMPEVQRKLATLGYEADPLGPQPFEAMLRQENAKWSAIVRRANIKAD